MSISVDELLKRYSHVPSPVCGICLDQIKALDVGDKVIYRGVEYTYSNEWPYQYIFKVKDEFGYNKTIHCIRDIAVLPFTDTLEYPDYLTEDVFKVGATEMTNYDRYKSYREVSSPYSYNSLCLKDIEDGARVNIDGNDFDFCCVRVDYAILCVIRTSTGTRYEFDLYEYGLLPDNYGWWKESPKRVTLLEKAKEQKEEDNRRRDSYQEIVDEFEYERNPNITHGGFCWNDLSDMKEWDRLECVCGTVLTVDSIFISSTDSYGHIVTKEHGKINLGSDLGILPLMSGKWSETCDYEIQYRLGPDSNDPTVARLLENPDPYVDGRNRLTFSELEGKVGQIVWGYNGGGWNSKEGFFEIESIDVNYITGTWVGGDWEEYCTCEWGILPDEDGDWYDSRGFAHLNYTDEQDLRNRPANTALNKEWWDGYLVTESNIGRLLERGARYTYVEDNDECCDLAIAEIDMGRVKIFWLDDREYCWLTYEELGIKATRMGDWNPNCIIFRESNVFNWKLSSNEYAVTDIEDMGEYSYYVYNDGYGNETDLEYSSVSGRWVYFRDRLGNEKCFTTHELGIAHDYGNWSNGSIRGMDEDEWRERQPHSNPYIKEEGWMERNDLDYLDRSDLMIVHDDGYEILCENVKVDGGKCTMMRLTEWKTGGEWQVCVPQSWERTMYQLGVEQDGSSWYRWGKCKRASSSDRNAIKDQDIPTDKKSPVVVMTTGPEEEFTDALRRKFGGSIEVNEDEISIDGRKTYTFEKERGEFKLYYA